MRRRLSGVDQIVAGSLRPRFVSSRMAVVIDSWNILPEVRNLPVGKKIERVARPLDFAQSIFLQRQTPFMRSLTAALLLTAVASRRAIAQPTQPDSTNDPYRWLEEMTGARAMDWVKSENARTNAVLEKDPRYTGNDASALTLAQTSDRLPFVSFIGGKLYNFWPDAQHARKFAAKRADMMLPYLFYEVIEGGHGSGANAEQQAHTSALEYTYFMRQLMR